MYGYVKGEITMNQIPRILLATVILAVLLSGMAMADTGLPGIPADLKTPDPSVPYADDMFIDDAGKIIKKISGHSVPVGMDRAEVYGAYLRLRDKNVSPDLYPMAGDIIGYLYYTAMAGKSYEGYRDLRDMLVITGRDSELYDTALAYHTAALSSWKNLTGTYPGLSPWTLPVKDADNLSVLPWKKVTEIS